MEPFVAEIRMFSFPFAPQGWAFCNGQTMPIMQNTALFSLLGTTYGGDAKTTFQLPNLQGNVPIGFSNDVPLGQTGGAAQVSLNIEGMPSHTHQLLGNNGPATRTTAAGNMLAATTAPTYSTASPNVATSMAGVSATGSSQPHNNLMPYLVVYYAIALQGIFPTRP